MVGKGLTVRPYPLIIASRYNIPYLLDAPGKGKNIKGEVYSVDEAMLDALDELEDAPKYYERKVERIIIGEEDEEVECFLYALTDFKDELLDEEFIDEYSAKIKPFVPKYFIFSLASRTNLKVCYFRLKREDMGRSKEYYFKDVKKPKVSST